LFCCRQYASDDFGRGDRIAVAVGDGFIRIRPRRTFANAQEARAFADLKRIERKNRGTLAVSMADSLRVAAIQAAEILRPFGSQESLIVEAAREYAARRELSHKSETLKNSVAAFLKAKKDDRARKRYLDDLSSRLGRFRRAFAERKVSDLTSGELDCWLRSLGLSPLGRNTYHLRIHTLLNTVAPAAGSLLTRSRPFPRPGSRKTLASASERRYRAFCAQCGVAPDPAAIIKAGATVYLSRTSLSFR
jgi:hypothetical protein